MAAADRRRGRIAGQAPAREPGGAVRRARVLLPYPFPGPFDYAVPAGMAPAPGDLVLVPLNRRAEVGVVWDGAPDPDLPAQRLKPIAALLEGPAMRADLRRLIDWIAAYTLAAPGEVLAMALRVNALRPEPAPVGWQHAESLPAGARITPARARVLAALADGPRGGPELARAAAVTPGLLRGMADAGLILPIALPPRPPFTPPDPDRPGPALSAAQQAAAAALCRAVAAREFSVTLLDGVTGSGKTEVYLEAVAECLRAGRQALVLLLMSRAERPAARRLACAS